MDYIVHLTKIGVQVLKFNADARQYLEEKISTTLHVLRCECYIDADITLEDIFRAVEQDPDLARFLQEWSWCNVHDFHLEARKPASKNVNLTHLEVGKSFEWDDLAAYEIIIFDGVGEPDECGSTHYAINFNPVNEFVHLPVRLRLKEEIWKDHKKLAEAPCTLTLLEVLGGIYWEISFHDSPESRDEFDAKLLQSVQDLEEGRATWEPLEQPKDQVN
jgi:hypothetical protein